MEQARQALKKLNVFTQLPARQGKRHVPKNRASMR
jgi:hypothetical protein